MTESTQERNANMLKLKQVSRTKLRTPNPPYDANNQPSGVINSSQAYTALVSARNLYLGLWDSRITKIITANFVGLTGFWVTVASYSPQQEELFSMYVLSNLILVINIVGIFYALHAYRIADQFRYKLEELENVNGIQGTIRVYSDKKFSDERRSWLLFQPYFSSLIFIQILMIVWAGSGANIVLFRLERTAKVENKKYFFIAMLASWLWLYLIWMPQEAYCRFYDYLSSKLYFKLWSFNNFILNKLLSLK